MHSSVGNGRKRAAYSPRIVETEQRSAFGDSYVRLSVQALQGVALSHLHSACDGTRRAPVRTGYAEWASDVAPRVSIGWDWCWRTGADAPEVVPLRYART